MTIAPGSAVFCRTCGQQIHPQAEVCPKCGVRQQQASTPSTGGKSKVTAGLLGILLGGFGVHKFYLGSVGLGIVYLLFFWTGVPALIGFIEGIIYLSSSEEAWNAKYNKKK